jgi:hypothetical protein
MSRVALGRSGVVGDDEGFGAVDDGGVAGANEEWGAVGDDPGAPAQRCDEGELGAIGEAEGVRGGEDRRAEHGPVGADCT